MPKSERTRLHLLSCAVAEMVESGPDRIGFTSIARRAGVSTGALYSRYESCDELLIDVWHSVSIPVLSELVGLLVTCKTDKPAARLHELASGALSATNPDFVATVSLMVLARRNEALHEVVNPSLRDLIDKASAEVVVIPHLLGYFTGAVLFERVHGMGVQDWAPVVDMMATLIAEVGSSPSLPTASLSVPLSIGPHISVDQGRTDDVDTRLLEAVVHVINRTGVDRATVSRIARRAEINPAVIYSNYEDKEHLVHECIRKVIAMGIDRYNEVVASYGSPLNAVDVFPGIFRVNGSRDSGTFGNFQLETTLAAGHDPMLRELLAGAKQRAAAAYESVTGVPDVHNMPLVWPFVVLNRAINFGQTLLLSYGYLDADDPLIHVVSRHIVATMRTGYEVALGRKWDPSAMSPVVREPKSGDE